MATSSGIKNYRAKVLLSFIAVYLISWLSILGATYFNLQEQKLENQTLVRDRFQQLYDLEIKGYRNAFLASLDSLTHPSRITDSFTLENKSLFLRNFAADYLNVSQRLSVTHFYFSTAERKNIARLHAPTRSGDVINRYTTVAAENTGETTSGVELGSLGSLTFRVVKPIYEEDTLQGFVELGRELDDVWRVASDQLNISVQVLINKPLLNETDWLKGKDIFGYQASWDSHENYVTVGGAKLDTAMVGVMDLALENHSIDQSGQVRFDNKNYLYTALPLIDFGQNRIGTILIAYPQDLLTTHLLEDLSGAAVWSAVAMLAGLVVCFILLTPAARTIQSRHRELEKEIAARTSDLSAAKEEAIKAKDSAEIANKAKSEFLSNMSHELRTPLNAIIGFSSIVKNDELAEGIGDKYQSYVCDIHSSGTHLLEIINDILDVSRIEAGELEMRFQQIDLIRLMHECHQMVNVRATDRSVPVIHDSYASEIFIDADPTRMKQILLNLLSNAVKFTDPPGVVRLYAEELPGDNVRIVVTDEGIGVAKKDLPVILRRFGKAANSALAKQKEEGTGLGLTLVQDLVKKHCGSFHFESEFGVGTTVTITLPKQQDDSGCDDMI